MKHKRPSSMTSAVEEIGTTMNSLKELTEQRAITTNILETRKLTKLDESRMPTVTLDVTNPYTYPNNDAMYLWSSCLPITYYEKICKYTHKVHSERIGGECEKYSDNNGDEQQDNNNASRPMNRSKRKSFISQRYAHYAITADVEAIRANRKGSLSSISLQLPTLKPRTVLPATFSPPSRFPKAVQLPELDMTFMTSTHDTNEQSVEIEELKTNEDIKDEVQVMLVHPENPGLEVEIDEDFMDDLPEDELIISSPYTHRSPNSLRSPRANLQLHSRTPSSTKSPRSLKSTTRGARTPTSTKSSLRRASIKSAISEINPYKKFLHLRVTDLLLANGVFHAREDGVYVSIQQRQVSQAFSVPWPNGLATGQRNAAQAPAFQLPFLNSRAVLTTSQTNRHISSSQSQTRGRSSSSTRSITSPSVNLRNSTSFAASAPPSNIDLATDDERTLYDLMVYLGSLPLFISLRADRMLKMSECLHPRSFDENEIVAHEGDKCESLFLISKGRIDCKLILEKEKFNSDYLTNDNKTLQQTRTSRSSTDAQASLGHTNYRRRFHDTHSAFFTSCCLAVHDICGEDVLLSGNRLSTIVSMTPSLLYEISLNDFLHCLDDITTTSVYQYATYQRCLNERHATVRAQYRSSYHSVPVPFTLFMKPVSLPNFNGSQDSNSLNDENQISNNFLASISNFTYMAQQQVFHSQRIKKFPTIS